jgi:hypothetical protein
MRRVNIILVLLLAAQFAGCATTGKPIKVEQVRSIVPGKTAKTELLEMFGAPAAVAAKAEVLVIPGPLRFVSPNSNFRSSFPNRYSSRFDTDTFFALFASAAEHHRIYYFYHAVSYRHPVWYLVYFGEGGHMSTDRLWVLVDEQTGIVEDYAFKEYGEDMLFGRNPAGRGAMITEGGR